MSINRPFHRNVRQFTDGTYANSGKSAYITHPKYAKSPEQYIRAFLLLLKDLQNLFDYIEPADKNLKCYSFRVHELLMRACIEVEANFKAILIENGYTGNGNSELDMEDYKKLEKTHRLSFYQIKLPHWYGDKSLRTPFRSWGVQEQYSPAWYQAYNKAKHNRHEQFHHANLENLIDGVCGLLALLSSQFYTQDFSPGDILLAVSGPGDGMKSAIGGYFRIKFPEWSGNERYDFSYQDWVTMAKENEPFQKIDYTEAIT